MPADELHRFLETWDAEAKKTAALLRALPAGQYDFRPDAGGRSLGELAWHLAEVEGYVGYGIEQGTLAPGTLKPQGIERPKSIEALAPGYERVHAEAVARVRRLGPSDLDRSIKYFSGAERPIRDILSSGLLFHSIHHRGQLSMLCRLAGGAAPGMFGPNREEMARRRG
jgi:uncharacterized damage-inducible protein DinB